MKTALNLALFTAFLLTVSPLYAVGRDSSLLLLPTNSKTVTLLYRKMAGLNFDSQDVLKSTEAYQKATPAEQAQILADQKTKLETEYASLDPQREVIVVRTSVGATASLLPPHQGLKITFVNSDRPAAAIYFPYSWAGLNVAIIPDHLDAYLDISLKASEASAAAAKIRDNTATMVIEMLPLKSDPTPMRLDGLDQRLVSAKIVAVSYYNQGMETIWQWQAPDYRRPGSASPLLDLKK